NCSKRPLTTESFIQTICSEQRSPTTLPVSRPFPLPPFFADGRSRRGDLILNWSGIFPSYLEKLLHRKLEFCYFPRFMRSPEELPPDPLIWNCSVLTRRINFRCEH